MPIAHLSRGTTTAKNDGIYDGTDDEVPDDNMALMVIMMIMALVMMWRKTLTTE